MANRVARILLFLGLCAALIPGRASAQDPRLHELSPGVGAAPNSQYIVLDLSGVSNLDGYVIKLYEPVTGAVPGSLATLGGPVTRPYLVIATPEAEAYWSFTADARLTGSLQEGTGRICLYDRGTGTIPGRGEVDCVAWGQFPPNENGSFGAPAQGVFVNQKLERIAYTGFNSTDWRVALGPDPTPFAGSGGMDGGMPDAGADAGPDGGPDAGASDGGQDAGGPPIVGGGGSQGGRVPDREVGCGCGAAAPAPGVAAEGIALFLLALLVARRRRGR